jgi:hypothetical protein
MKRSKNHPIFDFAQDRLLLRMNGLGFVAGLSGGDSEES